MKTSVKTTSGVKKHSTATESRNYSDGAAVFKYQTINQSIDQSMVTVNPDHKLYLTH